jgi:hypothetical protein
MITHRSPKQHANQLIQFNIKNSTLKNYHLIGTPNYPPTASG